MTENMNNPIRSAEILCVGTELLLGDIVNTNAAFLAAKLADLGIDVYRHTAVGDNPKRLSEAISSAFESADLVITSGGLGPTYDDLTKETAAAYFGRKMQLHEESLERIKSYFQKVGRVMTPNNEKQAMMPEGAIVFPNDYGTAPSLAICDENGKTIIMLPGPPNELTRIFDDQILPYLMSRSSRSVMASRNIHIFGMGESTVESKIYHIMTASANPTVAPYCKEGEVRLRVTAKSNTRQNALAMCDEMIERISATEVGEFIYGVDVDTLENAVLRKLRSKGLTLTAAESLTGGLIAKRITDLSGASDVFLGGCVTYTNQIKHKLIGVSEETLEKFGAVSAQCAMEMAKGVRTATGTDIAVSATGIAGPTGGTEETPVGTVFIGISTQDGESVRKLSLSSMKSRDYIRNISASNAFDMILKAVK